MNQKVLYSVMGLAAMPMVQTVAQNQNWTGTTMTVAGSQAVTDAATAEPLSFNIGKLAPGYYNLALQVTSKVYDVTVAVSGAKGTPNQVCNPGSTAQDVNVAFQVEDATKDIVISLASSDPGVSGSGYSITAPTTVSLSFDFATIKSTLATNAQTLANTISGYNYAAKQEDVDAANALKTKAEKVEESYDDYKKYKLYAEKSTIQEEIDALADKAAKAEAAYQNEQAYNRVNAAITAIKAKYNTAVAELEEALVGAAAYLLDEAKAELNKEINLKITEATSASYASYQAGTAVADEATNKGKIPTETELNNIVNKWKGQATDNTNAYNTLHGKVTTLQASLDAIKPASDAIAALFPKTEAQAAIDAINTKVEAAKNSDAQLTLNVNEDVKAAQAKITELEGKVNKANAEYNANVATTTAIAGVQKKLDDAKAAVNAKVSKDGNYKAQDYYAKYVEDVQAEITKLTTDAAAAYKVDGTGSAQTYNSGLAAKITAIEGEITPYQTNAVAAVAKYDELVAAMASYQKDLDEVRDLVKDLDIYNAEGYDYKTQLDLLQKRINAINKAIKEAQEKVGVDHWTAMNAIDKDEAITKDIKALKDGYQTAENTYDRNTLDTSLTGLADHITTFNTNATEAILGADYADFVAAEAAINAKVTAAQTERAAIVPADEKAPEKIVALGEKVDQIKADQKALEDAAAAVKAKVVANNSAKTGLATSINALQTKIGTFKDTYKIGTDASTLGNRGKAEGDVTKKVAEIEKALGELETKNDAVVTTVVSKVEKGVATNGLANGLYEVEVEVDAKAAGTLTVNFTETAYAAGKATSTVKAFVYDGTLKAAVSGKDDKVTVKKLTYHENSLDATYNNADEKNLGYNNTYSAQSEQYNKLDAAAPGIKAAVEKNAETYTAATKDVADLQAAELNTLKSLKNVTNDAAVSDDATAKKADPADFKVFETGLAADKSYTAKKAAIDADITALQAALDASKAAETMVEKWQNKSITVGEGDAAKTYSISAITNAINNLKAEAVAESDNYEAYKALQDNNMPKLLPDTITIKASDLGDGAVAYYQGLKDSYIAGKATILTDMRKDLNDRKAVSTKDGFVTKINDLIAKVKVVKSDGIANKKRYDEQKTAYTETQTLWNSTYTEIAATDHSSQVQKWLDDLDAIQVDLTAATETVETSYPKGESVAKTQDFAAIKGRINDVKAQQTEGYNAQIAADNKAAHESFMGTETTKGAIDLANDAYLKAVQERATYSTTNAEIEDAVTTAAAELDVILYNCPTDIEALTKAENDAYAAVTSPTVFDVSDYNTQATAIQTKIVNALDKFKDDVKNALGDFWAGKTAGYAAKVAAAEAAISDYKDEAKTDAFKDVQNLITKGTDGVKNLKLSDIEDAVAGLEKIDDMLTADKNTAAVKDIDIRLAEAEQKHNEVLAYINGVQIADDPNGIKNYNKNELEKAWYNNITNGAKKYAKNFNNRNAVKSNVDQFMTTATNSYNAVKQLVEDDANNTKAYNEMLAAWQEVAKVLEDAMAAADPYKYDTSFATLEEWLNDIQAELEDAKKWGYAVSYQTNDFDIDALETAINAELVNAFNNEKTSLQADIAELKNQYNAYVAAKGLDATAGEFKAAIDDLEKALNGAAIADLDDPADGFQFDEIVAATEALIQLQYAIADLETELLEANASTANADVLADFQGQLQTLEATASLEGIDPWVGNQSVNGKKISDWVAELSAQIADLQAAIEAEPNISFYKKQYQAQIDAIAKDLEPVVQAIEARQAQVEANNAAYAELNNELIRLQGLVDKAEEKVSEYEHFGWKYDFTTMFRSYNYYGTLTGGIQKTINDARNAVENANTNKTAQNYNLTISANVENTVKSYLNQSAYKELLAQIDDLNTELANAIDVANHVGKQKYSSVLWARLIAVKNDIQDDIDNLHYDVENSTWRRSYMVGNSWVYENCSDADYAVHMETVASIKGDIETLDESVDNLLVLGDANGDTKVNVLDYQKVVNMILDPTQQPEEDNDLFVNLDINQNEVIEVGDLTAIVNYILTQTWKDGYAAAKSFGAANESVTMDITPMQQNVRRYAINLQNTEDYTAFQLDVVLPEGMKIVGQSLSDRAGQSHKLYSRAQQDGSIRLLASSIKGESFSGSEGAVLYIDVETTSDFKGGSVEMMNILFSDVYAQTRAFAIGNGGEATGIDITAAMQTLKQKVYDLGGRMMNGLKKGVNIIQGADGQTKKVVK